MIVPVDSCYKLVANIVNKIGYVYFYMHSHVHFIYIGILFLQQHEMTVT